MVGRKQPQEKPKGLVKPPPPPPPPAPSSVIIEYTHVCPMCKAMLSSTARVPVSELDFEELRGMK